MKDVGKALGWSVSVGRAQSDDGSEMPAIAAHKGEAVVVFIPRAGTLTCYGTKPEAEPITSFRDQIMQKAGLSSEAIRWYEISASLKIYGRTGSALPAFSSIQAPKQSAIAESIFGSKVAVNQVRIAKALPPDFSGSLREIPDYGDISISPVPTSTDQVIVTMVARNPSLEKVLDVAQQLHDRAGGLVDG